MSSVNFLVPRSLTWDKLCALYLLIRAFVAPAGRVWFLRDLIKTGRIGIYFQDEEGIPEDCVDVDVQSRYHKSQYGSASERVVGEHPGVFNELPGIDHLLGLLGNNNQTGFLKRQLGSLVTLIRDLENVGTDTPSRERRLRNLDLVLPAVELYVTGCEDRLDWITGFDNPFTLSVLEQLTVEEQPDRAEWLEQLRAAFERVGDLQQRAADKIDDVEATVFEVPVRGNGTPAQGHFVTSDDTRLAVAYLRRFTHIVLLVVRRRNGNTAIFCRGRQDFGPLYRALNVREPELWFLDTRPQSPLLLNGSTSRQVNPSQLNKQDLIQLIQQHHIHIPRNKREEE